MPALVLLLAVLAFPAAALETENAGNGAGAEAAAESEAETGAGSEGIREDGMHLFTCDENGVRLETGAGIMYDITKENTVTVYGYGGEASRLSVPEKIDGCPVTAIAETAFFGNAYLVSVMLPDSITEIGREAFGAMTRLRTVTLPDGLQTIPESCFRNCGILKTVYLPSALQKIGENAFAGCVLLGELKMPAGVTEIGEESFLGCEQLILRCSEGSYAKKYADAHAISTDFSGTTAALACKVAGLTVLTAALFLLGRYLLRRYREKASGGKKIQTQ